MDSPHKGPVTRKMFPFDDVITYAQTCDRISFNSFACRGDDMEISTRFAFVVLCCGLLVNL